MARWSLTIFTLAFLFLVGCSSLPNRINHFHDDENQKLADEAVTLFDKFTDERQGLQGTLMKNLGIRTDLELAVAATQIAVVDESDLSSLSVQTWDDLWVQVTKSLGCPKRDASERDELLLSAIQALSGLEDPTERQEAQMRSIASYFIARASFRRSVNDVEGAIAKVPSSAMRNQARKSLRESKKPISDVLNDIRDGLVRQSKREFSFPEIPDRMGPGWTRLSDKLTGLMRVISSEAKSKDVLDLLLEERLIKRAQLSPKWRTVFLSAIEPFMKNGFILMAQEEKRKPLGLGNVSDLSASALRAFPASDRQSEARDLLKRIQQRIQAVNTIAAVFEALVKVQVRLSKLTTKRIGRASKVVDSLDAGKPTAMPAADNSFAMEKNLIDFAAELKSVLKDAATTAATNTSERGKARQLAKRIIRQAKSSKDPGSIYALVAMVGIGLRDGSNDSLNRLLGDLKDKLVKLEARFGTESCSELQPILKTVCEARDRNLRPVIMGGSSSVERIMTSGKELGGFVESFSGLQNGLGIQLDSLGAALQSFAQLEEDKDNTKTPEIIEASDATFDAEILENLITKNFEPAFDAKFTTEDGKEVKLKDHLVTLLSDIRAEGPAAKRRIVTFLKSLHEAQYDLERENVRHYSVLLTVAKDEVNRWRLLATECRRMAMRMGYSPAPNANPRQEAPLFVNKKTIGEWETKFGVGAKEDFEHQVASQDDYVLSVLRKVGQTAKAWQKAKGRVSFQWSKNTSHRDFYWNLRRSNRRVLDAVGLVDSYLMIRTMNRRFANYIGIRLQREVSEHDILLDGVIARVREADIREALQDLAAFHGTGITNDDIRGIFAATQATFVALLEID